MIGGVAEIIVITMIMAVNVIVHLISCENNLIWILALKNRFKAVAKNILALTVKIEQARQVSLVKVKVHKPVPIDLLAKRPIKALMQNQAKVPKMLVLEIVRVQRHVVLDVESRDKYEYLY